MDKMLPQGAKDFLAPQGARETLSRAGGNIGGFIFGGPEQLAAKGVAKFLPQGANILARSARGFGKGTAAMGSLELPQVLAGEKSPQSGIGTSLLGGALQGTGEAVAPFAAKIPGYFKGAVQKGKDILNAPKASAEIGGKIADVEGQIANAEAQFGYPSETKRGVSIVNKAQKSVMGDFEKQASELANKSRDVFTQHTPIAKERFNKLSKDTYAKYGDILKKGEEEALANGMTSEGYREEVIQPVLDTIEKTGAKTPAAQKLQSMFKAKEGLSDSAYAKADDAALDNFNNLDSIEKMKSLRSSIYKDGSDDFIQNQYSDLHSRFVGKYSKSLSKANESYGPMKQALRWGGKNIKPFNEHEIKKVADIMQKYHGGKLDETSTAYLKTLKSGRGPFKGSDLTKLEKSHQTALDSIEKEISANREFIKGLEGQHLEDLATVKKAGMESKLGKSNIIQDVAGMKSRQAQLKVLKESVDRDLKTRDDLIRFGIISGLSTLGVGTGVYALAKALHEK